jgi:Glycosyl transferase family 2
LESESQKEIPAEPMIPGAVRVASEAAAAPVEISIVVPAHNEATGIEASFAQLLPVLERLGTTWEVICVDDGSTDATLHLLLEFQWGTLAIKVIWSTCRSTIGGLRARRARLRMAPQMPSINQGRAEPVRSCSILRLKCQAQSDFWKLARSVSAWFELGRLVLCALDLLRRQRETARTIIGNCGLAKSSRRVIVT